MNLPADRNRWRIWEPSDRCSRRCASCSWTSMRDRPSGGGGTPLCRRLAARCLHSRTRHTWERMTQIGAAPNRPPSPPDLPHYPPSTWKWDLFCSSIEKVIFFVFSDFILWLKVLSWKIKSKKRKQVLFQFACVWKLMPWKNRAQYHLINVKWSQDNLKTLSYSFHVKRWNYPATVSHNNAKMIR